MYAVQKIVIHALINNNVFLTLTMYIYDWSRERSQVVTIDGTIVLEA